MWRFGDGEIGLLIIKSPGRHIPELHGDWFRPSDPVRSGQSLAIEVADEKDPEAFAAAVRVEDAKVEALEDRIEAGDTAGLAEAVPDSLEKDWTPAQEDKVDDAPVSESKVEEPKDEPKDD